MNCKNFKNKVYQACKDTLAERLQILDMESRSLANDLADETKSSAGDKFETAREMINIEREKVAERIGITKKMLGVLEVTRSGSADKVGDGSLVRSGSSWILIAVSLGEVAVDGEKVFVISPASPLGKLLFDQQKGAKVSFNSRAYSIDEIC